jgi:hypothetical protein
MVAMLFFQHDPIAIEDNLRYDINFLTFRLNKSITSLSLLHIPPQFTPLEIMPRCSAAGLDFRIIPAGFNSPLGFESYRLEFLTGFTLIYLAILQASYKALSQFLMIHRPPADHNRDDSIIRCLPKNNLNFWYFYPPLLVKKI